MTSPATAQKTTPSNAGTTTVRPWERRKFLDRRQRVRMTVAVSLSLVFHLSMITLFEIVLAFPREDMHYYAVSIMPTPDSSDTAPRPLDISRTSDQLALGRSRMFDADLPAVDLPVIEFAELERLRIRYDAAEPLSEIDRLPGTPRPTDTWARFGGELQRLGRSLRDIALSDDDTPEVAPPLTHRPAEGFEAHIEWSGPPRDRELLFAPPIKALWRVSPDTLRRPLEIVFKVDPGGRVTNVWSPMIDDDGLLDDVQMTLLQYRFAPLADYVADSSAPSAEQSGLLFIRAARSAS